MAFITLYIESNNLFMVKIKLNMDNYKFNIYNKILLWKKNKKEAFYG